MIRDFLVVYLPEQRAYSKCTVKSYRETLNLLIGFIKNITGNVVGKISFEHITRANIEAFLTWLETDRGCSVVTRNQRLAGIRSFISYAAGRNIDIIFCEQEIKNIPLKKSKSTMLKYFSESALKSILDAPDATTRNGFRDLVFMSLLYDTGARNQELLDLTVGSLHLVGANPEAVITGKGRKTRLVPLMTNTVNLCTKYIERYHSDSTSDSFLFFTMHSGIKCPMSPDNTERFIRKYGNIARQINKDVPEGLHPHMFRHARSIHLYRNGMPLALVSEWLGHANIETTQIYAYADTKMKREAIEKSTTAINTLLQNQNINACCDWENDEEMIMKLYGLA